MVKRFNTNFRQGNSLFGAVKLTKNADPCNYGYMVYGYLVFGLMHVRNSHCQLMNGVKMFEFLVWTIVKGILIIEKRYSNLWGKCNR